MIPSFLQNADLLFLAKENPAKVGYAALAVAEPGKLVDLSKEFLAAGYHLEDVSGLIASDGAVSVYHFAHFDNPGRITVMVVVPVDTPSFPSISSVYQGAEWHERETRDFFGFCYEGNPNFIPLLLAETMADVHPLMKDEGARATLASIFSAESREREILKQADGFTLLDVPVKEEPAPAPAPAPAEAPKAEAPAAAPAPKAEETKAPEAPKAEPEAVKAAPAAEKPEPEVKAEAAPKPKEEPKAPEAPKAEEAPKTEAPKAAPAKAESPAPKKVQGTVKKGKVVKSGKKGAGNA